MANGAVGGEDGHVRDADDGVVGVEDLLFAEGDGPGDVFRFDVVGHERVLAGGVVADVDRGGLEAVDLALEGGDADDFDGGVFVMLGELANLGKRGDAGAAPGGPEVEDDDFAFEIGEGFEAVAGGPREVEFGRGVADEGGLGVFDACGFVEFGENAVDERGGFGVGEVGFELGEEGAGGGFVFENLKVEHRLHDEDFGDGVGFLGFVFLDEGVEGGEFGGEGFGGVGAGLEFGLDLSDEGLQGGAGGFVGGFDEGGEKQSEKK